MNSGEFGAGALALLIGAGIWAAQGEPKPVVEPDEIRGGETYSEFDARRDEVSTDSFAGYGCTEDCGGHEAGYRWAELRGIEDSDDCGGKSWSFMEGCEAYVEEIGGVSRATGPRSWANSRMTSDGSLLPGPDGGMVIGGPLDGSILPGRDGGMVIGGALDGSILPGSDGGIVIGGPLDGSIVPGSEGGMIIGGPLDGTLVPGE